PGQSTFPAAAIPGWRRLMPVAVAVVLTAMITGSAAWAILRRGPQPRPIVRLRATPTSNSLTIDAFATDVAISADGSRGVYSAGVEPAQLWVRALDQSEPQPIRGPENGRGPFLSPDGEWVGYFQGSELKKVSIRGGPPVAVCQTCAAGNRGGSWGGDDTIV